MKKSIILILLVISLNSIYSISNKERTPDLIINEFFEGYNSSKPSKCVDTFFKGNKWMERKKDDVEQLKSSIDNITSLVGEYYGYDILTTKSLGDNYILYSILVRHDRQPIRFILHFYKADKIWYGYNLNYDDNFDDELEEAAKIYYHNFEK